MPQLAAGTWLNVAQPLSREHLRGQVVLIDFWDYTCVNCVRTLPYLQRWHRRYADNGLVVIGIHAPEFAFARTRMHVERALADLQIPYPVLLDNEYENWDRFANKAWPTKYLIDSRGYIRFRRQGEGYYRDTERAIQMLLRLRDSNVTLPDLLPPLREEDTPGAVCYRPTPELYAGYQGGGLFGGGLGNPSGYVPEKPVFYELPPAKEREVGRFYVEGVWRAWPEALAYVGQSGGRLVVPYEAATVNAVLSPSADPVELALDLRPAEAVDPVVVVRQNGRYLSPHHAGADVAFRADGTSYVRVTAPRMYQLVQNQSCEWHELSLTFAATGLAVYAFTFTTCVTPQGDRDRTDTFRVH